jgi:hypothetical protein
MSGIFKNHKKGKGENSPRPAPSASTNWGDDEYAAVIEGVKKIYKTKIKPLEVTYNFEGKYTIHSNYSRVTYTVT